MRKRIGWAIAQISTRSRTISTPAIDCKSPLQTLGARAASDNLMSALHRQKKNGGTIVVVGAFDALPAP